MVITEKDLKNIGKVSLYNLRVYIGGFQNMIIRGRISDAKHEYSCIFTEKEMKDLAKEIGYSI